MKKLSFILLLLALPQLAEAQTSRRLGIGNNNGKPQLSEEDRVAARDNQMIERLSGIEALLKQGQEQQAQQLELLQQQNDLLNRIYEIDAARYDQIQQIGRRPPADQTQQQVPYQQVPAEQPDQPQ